LAAAGSEVTFVARGAHLEAIRRHGLRLTSPLGDAHIVPANAVKTIAEVGRSRYRCGEALGYRGDCPRPTANLQQSLIRMEACLERILSARLYAAKTIVYLNAPLGFSERLHARLAQEIDGSSREPDED
jgi:hypothetical protein